MKRYRTTDGDMLDAICKAELGNEALAPAVLDMNPGLAALGPVYHAGVIVMLPDIAPPVTTLRVRLWGRG